MATAEEIQEEAHRRSMYEVSKEIRESKTSVSRLMYIGKINKDDPQHKFDINEDINRFKTKNGVEFTGLLISTGSYIIHLVEGSTETLFALVKWNEKLMKQDPAPFTALTFPVFTEENPVSLFKYWTSALTNPQSSGEDDPENFLPEEISWGLYSNMLEIGTKHGQLSTMEITDKIKQSSNSKRLLFKQEVLSLLLTDKFPNLQDFIEIYIAPIDIVFENELVWPCPPELNF
ncbi:hypothetical protein SteCoe_24384 [Stentor coeruleus]|uniref:BLUF domain-containing protein n=1 Tax=Stentor coeruleus TaxID=5963 RepID=A0A1R2BHQ5_9CILI|nr:hypothetical protein SteCoe_24384 [Stentor coeruleus]